MNTWTREYKLADQRARRAANGNAYTKRYEKTINGFLMRAYRNMESRAKGIQRLKAHLYIGVEVLPRDDFYRWAKSSATFAALWREWVESGHDQRMTPSVDRIDSNGSYSLDNMQWVTHSENSRRGATSPKRYLRDSRLARAA